MPRAARRRGRCSRFPRCGRSAGETGAPGPGLGRKWSASYQQCIGMVGYFGGADVCIVDDMAIGDPLLARLPPIPDPCWRIGHFRRMRLAGYLETLERENFLADRGLAAYYDHLALVTRGSLWDCAGCRRFTI